MVRNNLQRLFSEEAMRELEDLTNEEAIAEAVELLMIGDFKAAALYGRIYDVTDQILTYYNLKITEDRGTRIKGQFLEAAKKQDSAIDYYVAAGRYDLAGDLAFKLGQHEKALDFFDKANLPVRKSAVYQAMGNSEQEEQCLRGYATSLLGSHTHNSLGVLMLKLLDDDDDDFYYK